MLFEGPLTPFDWGQKDCRPKQKNACTLAKVEHLVARYHPAVLVLETLPRGARQTPRLRALYLALRHLAASEDIAIIEYSRGAIRSSFSPLGARTKYEIAQVIARQIPAFHHRLPRLRSKCWMSLDLRQSLFDAAALGLTYYMGLSSTPKRAPLGE